MEQWKEYFIYDATIALTGGAGTIYQSLSIKIDTDSQFEWNKTTFTATNDRIRVKFKDDSLGRYLVKGTPDIKTIAGRNTLPMGLSNSFIPFILARPYTITGGSNFTVEATDFSGGANTMRLALHGAKVRKGNPPWLNLRGDAIRVPFSYSFKNGPVTVAANSTSSQTFEMDNDSDFIIRRITGIRTDEALVKIGENYTGRDWSNTNIHIDNLIGNGAFPNILQYPRFIPRGSTILVNLQDLSGNANIIDITLSGEKIYG